LVKAAAELRKTAVFHLLVLCFISLSVFLIVNSDEFTVLHIHLRSTVCIVSVSVCAVIIVVLL